MKSLLVLLSFFASTAFANVEVGKPAPNFSLKGNDGKTYDLTSLKGQWVVLEWFNNECPYVEKHYNEEFRNMQNLQKKWVDEGKKHGGLNWFAVNSSAKGKQGHLDAASATKLKNDVRKANMTAILLDADGKVGKMYGAKTTPHMFIINPEGQLVYNGAIDDQPSSRTSTLKGANNYVSTALDSLFNKKQVAQATTKPYGCSVKY